MDIVYLAGGMRSGWQDKVIEACPKYVTFLDPRSHGLQEAEHYTEWDLDAIRSCNILFGYLEKDNPAGHNLALEIGYAYALKKIIIFVDEKSGTIGLSERHTAMLREVSIYFKKFDDGLPYLKNLVTFW